MINGVGHMDLNPEQFVSPEGVVNVAKLMATLAHEGRHLHDERTLGFTDRPNPEKWFTNLDQYRWSAKNAARAEDAVSKALGLETLAKTVDYRAGEELYAVRQEEPKLKDYGRVKRAAP